LDPLATKLFDRQDGGVVSWDESESGDDHAASGDFEETLPRCTRLSVITDLLEDDVLIQVDTVEAGKTNVG